MSAPLVAGACALLFQCRGAAATWANLKQILENTAGTAGLAIPGTPLASASCRSAPPARRRPPASMCGCATMPATPARSLSPAGGVVQSRHRRAGHRRQPGPKSDLRPDEALQQHHPRHRAQPRHARRRATPRSISTGRDPATNIPYPARGTCRHLHRCTRLSRLSAT